MNTMITFNSANQVSVQTLQPTQNHPPTHVLQLNELRLFYQAPNDDNFYHVICKMVLQDYQLENFVCDDDNYDYEFFFQSSNDTRYHVTCKLLSRSLIINILNKEIYGRDFDVNGLNRNHLLLTSHQKLNLELNLKKILPWYLSQHHNIDSNEILNVTHENIESVTQPYSMIDNQNSFEDSWQCDGYISQQDENETGIYDQQQSDFTLFQ